uniref:Granulins domain-containing protein n=1 Tax=Electrophorus electricus TaxID=8005 RepID=A0A4W4H0X9_ELEEL
ILESNLCLIAMLLMAGLVTSAVHCPDGTQCQDRNTCCSTNMGYACCPYPSVRGNYTVS